MKEINTDIEHFATKYNVLDRVNKVMRPLQEAFLTIKDHKKDFEHTKPCRLINPAKSDLGVISKSVLDVILKSLRETIIPSLHQFKDVNDCLAWFHSLEKERTKALVTFDIKEFYPSISEKILKNALFWAKNTMPHDMKDKCDTELILAARKSILCFDGEIWTKNTGFFDVTMGSPDGAEVSELVGLYLLHKLIGQNIVKHNTVGLYRDDGIIALSSKSGRANDKIKCKIQDFFKSEGFSIEFSLVDSFVDYLDVRLHSNQTHESYHKPNSDKVYVHKLSNHPPSVLKNIQANTELRLSKLNSNEKLFKNNAEFYSKVLAKSGHNSALNYQKDLAQNKKSKKRKRPNNRITWYNPPWNCDLKTNLGKKFQNLISNHFKDDLAWLNSRTIKLSYSTVNNVKADYTAHNRKLLSKNSKKSKKVGACSCHTIRKGVPRVCDMPEICSLKNVVYECKITENSGEYSGQSESYVGITKGRFIARKRQHETSFLIRESKTATTLSEFVHDLKEGGIEHSFQWKILQQARSYSGTKSECQLCLAEKSRIFYAEQPLLNQRSELFAKCKHRKIFKFKPPDQPLSRAPSSSESE